MPDSAMIISMLEEKIREIRMSASIPELQGYEPMKRIRISVLTSLLRRAQNENR